MMVAIPLARIVEGHDKQVRSLQLLQNSLTRLIHGGYRIERRRRGVRGSAWALCPSRGKTQNGITQRGAHAVKDRGLQQEGLHVSGLACEDLGSQIIQNISVAAAKGADEAGAVALIVQ